VYAIRAVVPSGIGFDVCIVAIVGPTATAKTATAVLLAKKLNAEIISADSVAIYRGLDVGAAKPGQDERDRIPFHLLDVVEPNEACNVATFKRLAEGAILDIVSTRRTPLIVGGTGLYVRALLENYNLTETPPDAALRAELETEARNFGTASMHAKLAALDPLAASRIHPNDKVRILRALEVCIRTGKEISARHAANAESRTPKPARKFALTASREELNTRIDLRVDRMIAGGLEQEVRNLTSRGFGRDLPSMRTLGYKEMLAYVSGECNLGPAVEEIKRNTRRFAKRQLTWFRAEKGLEWIDIGQREPAEIAGEILDRLSVQACV
jgi:tRNA dimethylallyltransferase